MTAYLQKTFNWHSEELVSTFDDFTVWASMSGSMMLEYIPMALNKTILDIGFGTGFPLVELAERFGSSCQFFGVDPWSEAAQLTAKKLKNREITNVTLMVGHAESMDISAESIDMITSNLGINNFDNPEAVLAECRRLLKPDGKLIMTSNVVGTFQEFYDVFQIVLESFGNEEYLQKLEAHVNHRATVAGLESRLLKCGFERDKSLEKTHIMRFASGSSFLNSYFVVMCFLPSWIKIVDEQDRISIFNQVEQKLNVKAIEMNGLNMQVPNVYLEFSKSK